jgi:hypothetical protein
MRHRQTQTIDIYDDKKHEPIDRKSVLDAINVDLRANS